MTVVTQSKLAHNEIKWPELLAHFCAVQTRHEQVHHAALSCVPDVSATLPSSAPQSAPSHGGVSLDLGRFRHRRHP
jgi:hypothetical protein